MDREVIEKLALEAVPADIYYELLDSIGELSDDDLIDIINENESVAA